MALHVLRDPRPYLLVVMAVALTVIAPLIYAFVTLMDTVFGAGASAGWIVLWVLVGVAVVALVIGLEVILARATRLSDLEHETPGRGEDRAPERHASSGFVRRPLVLEIGRWCCPRGVGDAASTAINR